ncbi:MAG TPA: hypothetical protein VFI65_14545 [Streptosporangiaceae bacterium]|nr:hypothetical protein [Streptosporangiaceae bacterium]
MRRLDSTHSELVSATRGSLPRVRHTLAREWSVRFKDLLFEHPGIEADVASTVADIRMKADEVIAHPVTSGRMAAIRTADLGPRPSTLALSAGKPDGNGFNRIVRWMLIGSAAIAAFVAATHQIFMRKTPADGVPPWAHWLLTWPTSSAQPILGGCAAICLCALAFESTDWHKPTERLTVSAIGTGLAAAISAGPVMLVCWMVAIRTMTG